MNIQQATGGRVDASPEPHDLDATIRQWGARFLRMSASWLFVSQLLLGTPEFTLERVDKQKSEVQPKDGVRIY